MSDNGNAQVSELDHLFLAFDRKTMTLTISGDAWDRVAQRDPRAFDLLLAMLGQATRHVETQFRIIAGMEAQAAQRAAQEEYNRVQRLMGKA
jgi:hypothetical protein